MAKGKPQSWVFIRGDAVPLACAASLWPFWKMTARAGLSCSYWPGMVRSGVRVLIRPRSRLLWTVQRLRLEPTDVATMAKSHDNHAGHKEKTNKGTGVSKRATGYTKALTKQKHAAFKRHAGRKK